MCDKISTNAVWSKIDGDEEPMVNSRSNSNINSSNKACYKCGGIIPMESEFCPYCGIKLSLDCPKCNNRYSSQFKFCPKCGVNKDGYLEQLRIKELQIKKEQELQEAKARKIAEAEKKKEEELRRIKNEKDAYLRGLVQTRDGQKKLLLTKEKYVGWNLFADFSIAVSIALFFCSLIISIILFNVTVPPNINEPCYEIVEINPVIKSYDPLSPYMRKLNSLYEGKTFKIKKVNNNIIFRCIDGVYKGGINDNSDVNIHKQHLKLHELLNEVLLNDYEIKFFNMGGNLLPKDGFAHIYQNGLLTFTMRYKYRPQSSKITFNLEEGISLGLQRIKTLTSETKKFRVYYHFNYVDFSGNMAFIDGLCGLSLPTSNIKNVKCERKDYGFNLLINYYDPISKRELEETVTVYDMP